MKRKGLALIAGCLALIVSAHTATAQMNRNCGTRDHVVTRLADKYGETRRSMGLGANNQIVEIFASDETGTWTITVTMPTGMTCLVASGQAFEAVEDDVTPTKGTSL